MRFAHFTWATYRMIPFPVAYLRPLCRTCTRISSFNFWDIPKILLHHVEKVTFSTWCRRIMLITPILKEEIRVQNQSFPLIFALLLILSVGERLLRGNIKQKKSIRKSGWLWYSFYLTIGAFRSFGTDFSHRNSTAYVWARSLLDTLDGIIRCGAVRGRW